ncbi:hypothetical protein BQ8794_210109 [Mesorhizobium prunaredense]|uniref:Uncharacterized protein n=1 Tax=Mesorhizobium prunaredense TaxID=1631249 RepID=A0A1R3VAP5_9HYPH|nr:hypothetical protein [Mesorhizobium prunaredense]SIT55416.1 hypothetical protein BQ8794_210109 [Mesorhizobium prunaredense]
MNERALAFLKMGGSLPWVQIPPLPPILFALAALVERFRSDRAWRDQEDILPILPPSTVTEIMEKAGRHRDADGNWSQVDLDWLWAECAKRVTGPVPEGST